MGFQVETVASGFLFRDTFLLRQVSPKFGSQRRLHTETLPSRNAESMLGSFEDLSFFMSWKVESTDISQDCLLHFTAKSPGKSAETNHKISLEESRQGKTYRKFVELPRCRCNPQVSLVEGLELPNWVAKKSIRIKGKYANFASKILVGTKGEKWPKTGTPLPTTSPFRSLELAH